LRVDAWPRRRYETDVRSISALLAMITLSCGGSPPPPAEEPTEDPRPHEQEPSPPPDDLRALGQDPTYAELLDTARTLDDRRDQDSAAGCLLAERGARWRLEADLAVAVRPLPPAPDDLDEMLESDPGPVNVLSRWGAYGTGDPAHAGFVAVTTTLPPRREPAIVWIVTSEGVYVRSSAAAATERGARTPEQARALLDASAGALFVTAEASTPLERIAGVLAQIPEELAGRVGFAVALAPGTRLPRAPAETVAPGGALCAGGLPAPGEGDAQGDLAPRVIVQSLGPLRQAAESCVSFAQGPGASGGRIELALRIGADGSVSEACAVSDSSGDASLRECLVRAARATAFPAPSPPGYVDVQLPLVLAPSESSRQRPLCP
jgi:hypothetical protein